MTGIFLATVIAGACILIFSINARIKTTSRALLRALNVLTFIGMLGMLTPFIGGLIILQGDAHESDQNRDPFWGPGVELDDPAD